MIEPEGEVRRVAEVVLGRILAGDYPKGLRLPAESALAEELGCGRSTVREALRYLADLGLVRSRRGSGATVLDFRREGTPALMPAYLQSGAVDIPPATLAAEMLRLRKMMALEAVRLAATYASGEALGEAREHLRAAPDLERDPAAHALNELDFYRALVVASGIHPATWLVNALWRPTRELNARIAPLFGPVDPRFQPTMETLLEHIAARRSDEAVAHLDVWFARVDAELVAVITQMFTLASSSS